MGESKRRGEGKEGRKVRQMWVWVCPNSKASPGSSALQCAYMLIRMCIEGDQDSDHEGSHYQQEARPRLRGESCIHSAAPEAFLTELQNRDKIFLVVQNGSYFSNRLNSENLGLYTHTIWYAYSPIQTETKQSGRQGFGSLPQLPSF